MSIDLHVHSTASDGTVPPAALVAEAARRGLFALAVSDHDSVAGVPEALSAGETHGIRVVPALELSASAEGRDMHILGYRVDHTDPLLLERLAELRVRRERRALEMVDALRRGGYDLDPAAVLRLAGGGAVGRAHVARALAEAGLAETPGEAFRLLIGHGRPYFVPKPVVTPDETIRLITATGGVAVLAHPGISKVDDLLDALISAGLAGIEVWHSEHSPEDVTRYERLASERGLVATGGSDYHGPGASGGGGWLGCVEVPDSVIDALYALPAMTSR